MAGRVDHAARARRRAERLWDAPCTPPRCAGARERVADSEETVPARSSRGSTRSRVIAEQRDYLTQLDAAIGDADHGTNMNRGFARSWRSAAGPADRPAWPLLITAGRRWSRPSAARAARSGDLRCAAPGAVARRRRGSTAPRSPTRSTPRSAASSSSARRSAGRQDDGRRAGAGRRRAAGRRSARGGRRPAAVSGRRDAAEAGMRRPAAPGPQGPRVIPGRAEHRPPGSRARPRRR